MYEPFHPHSGKPFEGFPPYLYIRTSDPPNSMIGAARDVFSGRYCTDFTDRDNKSLRYDGLVIKDIYANLLAGWAANQFQHVKIVLLLRNPFSVALSKSQTKYWNWPSDPTVFTTQDKLMGDYAGKFGDLGRYTNADFVARQILVWSVLNCVSIDQLAGSSVYLLFYEDVLENPNVEIDRLMQYSFGNKFAKYPPLGEATVKLDSRGSSGSRTAAADCQTDWQSRVDRHTLRQGMMTLRDFNVDFLYGDTVSPLFRSGPLRAGAG
jgi:hypothetical protein